MLYSYVPSLVKCRIFGVELKGLSKDSIVSIERIDGATTFRKAQDGSQTAFSDTNGSYRVTINIEQVSSSNEFLHTIFKLHRNSGLNIRIPLSVTEETRFGGTKFNASDVFFKTEPIVAFTSESVPRQWVFICNNASFGIGGTAERSIIMDSLQAVIRMIEVAESLSIDLSKIENIIGDGVKEAQQRLKDLF